MKTLIALAASAVVSLSVVGVTANSLSKERQEAQAEIKHLRFQLEHTQEQVRDREEILNKMIEDARVAIKESGVKIPQGMFNWQMFTYVVRQLKKHG